MTVLDILKTYSYYCMDSCFHIFLPLNVKIFFSVSHKRCLLRLNDVKGHAVRHFVLYMVCLYVVVCVFSRHKLAFSQSRVTSYLFDGSGFALVNNIERRGKIGIVTRFDIEVRTVANNGILFLMVNEVNMLPL